LVLKEEKVYVLKDKKLRMEIIWLHYCYKFKTLELVKKMNLVLGLTQENSIESSIQSRLFYIPIQIVYANYYAPYPKRPCVRHEVNI